jgi:hypothetical protein
MKSIKLLLLLFLSCYSLFAQDRPAAERGVLDARSWNFNERMIPLNGYWNFYENKLINFSDSAHESGSVSNFPAVWKPSVQYATYHLLVLMPADTGKYGLELPQLYCSYKLWVNGVEVAANGKVGTTKESTTPQWLPQSATINKKSDTLSIVLQIANFYHFKGGSKEPIYLGKAAIVEKNQNISVNCSVVESISLAILGLVFFIIYYIRQERKKITLYFSLLCVSWAIRAVFSNEYAFISYMPSFNWGIMIRIEYITLFLTMIWAILFLGRLFPNENSKTIKYFLVGTNSFFIALTVIASPVFFTEWLTVYLSIAGLLLLFGISIVIRAWINERSGVRYLVICVFLCISIFAYDIFVYEGLFQYYNAVLFSVGYLVMFMLMGVSLLYHLKIFTGDSSSSTLTYEDLYGKSK